jgi:ABC-type multidrug transport system fused ATPase/permease subunit
MFMGLMNEILAPLNLLGDILPQYNRRARHMDKYLKLLVEEDMVKDPKRAKKIKDVKGRIEFKNVSFVYPDTKNGEATIKNLSFTIESGQQIALVGHSGCGKTTIVSLLTRLVDPTDGQILMDGVDIRKYKQADYNKHLGTVLQEHSLYNETIAENIAYGKLNASSAEIVAAAKMAQAHNYIKKLPDGYETKIGERGVRLSGGEKQRLAIARAILKNPQIVVLDEPTSALDSITEAKVQKGLIKLIEEKTSVTVAHRLSTVRNSDKILVIDEGELMASGSHMELLRSCKDYRDMVDLQTGGFLAE